MEKRIISNEEYELAYNLIDNKKIMNAAAQSFRKKLSSDIIESCCNYALLVCLQKHDNSYKRKFTTSLYMFVKWYCQQALNKENKHVNVKIKPVNPNIPLKDHLSAKQEVFNILNLLPENEKRLLTSRFLEGKTLIEIGEEYGYTKQKARSVINKLLKKIRVGV